jgi:hypothetical protein
MSALVRPALPPPGGATRAGLAIKRDGETQRFDGPSSGRRSRRGPQRPVTAVDVETIVDRIEVAAVTRASSTDRIGELT